MAQTSLKIKKSKYLVLTIVALCLPVLINLSQITIKYEVCINRRFVAVFCGHGKRIKLFRRKLIC